MMGYIRIPRDFRKEIEFVLFLHETNEKYASPEARAELQPKILDALGALMADAVSSLAPMDITTTLWTDSNIQEICEQVR